MWRRELLDQLMNLLGMLGIILLLLFILQGCMSLQGCTLTVNNESGSVNIMTKDVTVPVSATVPEILDI
jgi:hypothetical protein